ncbi:MAG TPA: hypothetical protein VHB54_19695 [Mucilaginibacter sp.]|nr:hypothetical protein [Mucilaginibacter sp.]
MTGQRLTDSQVGKSQYFRKIFCQLNTFCMCLLATAVYGHSVFGQAYHGSGGMPAAKTIILQYNFEVGYKGRLVGHGRISKNGANLAHSINTWYV